MSSDRSDSTWQDSHTWVEPGDGEHGAGRAPDRYELRELLGRGGSGEVWLAYDRELQREVAYKALHLAPEGATARRFLREARLTAGLEHPGIVPVHDAGRRPDGGLFYVMQVVRGRSLDQVIADCADIGERLALVDALVDTCQAVAFAHERGIIHRDLKPHNIMIGTLGETRVVDWGLARQVDPGDRETSRVGAIVGSPRYMSPEQAAGREVDARTDVWALGTMLHELLTGRPRVEGDSGMDVVARIARLDLPAVERMEGPPELVAITARALAVDPDHRYPHAGALLKDLKAWRTGRRVSAYRYSPAEELTRLVRRYRWPLTGLALGLVVAGLVAVDGVRRTRAERDRAREAEQVARKAEADALQARGDMARALQDAYLGQAQRALDDDDPVGALVRAAAALELGAEPRARAVAAHLLDQVPYRWLDTRLELPSRCRGLIPWGDGSWICRGSGVWRVDGAEAVQLETRRARSVQPSVDGRWLVLGDQGAWWRVIDPVSGEEVFSSEQVDLPMPQAVRPDGMAAVFDVREVSVVDLRSGEVRWTQRVPSIIGRVAWAGDDLHVSQASGRVEVLDVRSGASRGMWPEMATGGAWDGAFSRDGQRLLYMTMGGSVGVLHADGTRQILRGHGRRARVGWSGDEGAVWASDGDGITAWTADGQPLLRLPAAGGGRWIPVAMPDARTAHLVFEDTLAAVEVVDVARSYRRTLPAAAARCRPEPDGMLLCSLANWRLARIDPMGEAPMVALGSFWSHAVCRTGDGLLGTSGGRLVRFTGGLQWDEHVVGAQGEVLLPLECGVDGRWATAGGRELWIGQGAQFEVVELEAPVDRVVPWGEAWLVRAGREWSSWSAEGQALGPVALDAWDVAAGRPSVGKVVTRGRRGLQVEDLRGEAPHVEIEGSREPGPVVWVDDRRVAIADAAGLRVVDVADGSVRMHVDDHKGTIALLQVVEGLGRGPLLLAGDHEARLFSWDLGALDLDDAELVAEIGRSTGLRVEGAGLSWVER